MLNLVITWESLDGDCLSNELLVIRHCFAGLGNCIPFIRVIRRVNSIQWHFCKKFNYYSIYISLIKYIIHSDPLVNDFERVAQVYRSYGVETSFGKSACQDGKSMRCDIKIWRLASGLYCSHPQFSSHFVPQGATVDRGEPPEGRWMLNAFKI